MGDTSTGRSSTDTLASRLLASGALVEDRGSSLSAPWDTVKNRLPTPAVPPPVLVTTHAIVCRPSLSAATLIPKMPSAWLTPGYWSAGNAAVRSGRSVHAPGEP